MERLELGSFSAVGCNSLPFQWSAGRQKPGVKDRSVLAPLCVSVTDTGSLASASDRRSPVGQSGMAGPKASCGPWSAAARVGSSDILYGG